MSIARGSVIRFLVIIGLFQAIAMSVFLAYLIGFAHAAGGTLLLDIQSYGEGYLEFWAMVFIVPTIAIAAFYILETLPPADAFE